MTHEINLEEAATLKTLIGEIQLGGEVVLTEGNIPIAKLIAIPKGESKPNRKAGFAKGSILYIADDFDAPLEDFKDYM